MTSSATNLGSEAGDDTAGEIVRLLRGWSAEHTALAVSPETKTKLERRDYETMGIALARAAGEIERRYRK